MLASLNRVLDQEFSRAPLQQSVAKAANPYDMLSTGSSGSISDYFYSQQSEVQKEQFRHNRGRFYSAARIIVARFAQQPIYCARETRSRTSRSISELIQKSAMPPSSVSEWIGPSDNVELVSRHSALSALSAPNDLLTTFNMKEMIAWSIVVTGSGFLVAVGRKEGRPFDLFPLPATWMTRLDKTGLASHWSILPPGSTDRPVVVEARQVAHFYFADPENPAACLSPLAMLARAVMTDEAIAESQHNEFKNGVMPKVALIAGDVMNETSFTDDPNRTSSARPVRLEPHQRQQIITWFKQQFSGVQKANHPLVLDAIIRDVKMLSRTMVEMGFIDSAGLTKEQIFEGLGVSRILTGQLEGVNRASGGLAEQFFADNTLNPMITMFSQALTAKLGPLFAMDGERLLIWMAPAMPRDTELDIEYLRLGVRSYSLERNDVRNILRTRFGGLPPLDYMNDVVMPQTLDERDEDSDREGVGRISIDTPEPQSERRFSLNGSH